MARVRDFLPPSTDPNVTTPTDQLRSTVQSPQFQQVYIFFPLKMYSYLVLYIDFYLRNIYTGTVLANHVYIMSLASS